MLAGLIPTLQRNLPAMVLALATALIVFNGLAMLVLRPVGGGAYSEAGAIPGITICEYFPTGDIESCTGQN